MTSWTESDLSNLEEAIALGARVVEYQDKKVEYRSLNDMIKLRNQMRVELGAVSDQAQKTATGGRRIHMTHSKGL